MHLNELMADVEKVSQGYAAKFGIEKEVVDVLCHVLLLAKHHNVDLDKEISEKWLVWKDAR